MNGIELESVRSATDEIRELIGELDRTLAQDYAPEQRHGLTLEGIFAPHVRFFIARRDSFAVGCGGVALFDGFAEVKRMYVRESARGRGVARALLTRLEREAERNGRDLLRLETGERQLAAMRLYERAGFAPCEPFGAYVAMAPQAIATSVFLEKRLAAAS